MKLPPFTLVYRPGRADAAERKRSDRQVAKLEEHDADLASALKDLKPALRRSLLKTVEPSTDLAYSAEMVSRATKELTRQEKVETVGFWDLSSQVGELPRVIEALNAGQPTFAFFEVQAAVPSGLISRPVRVVEWAEGLLGRRLTKKERESVASSAIFEEWEERAQQVRRELGIQHLIGVVPALVASGDESGVLWDLYSAGRSGVALVSTVDLYSFARQARRPFEVAVAMLAVSMLLATLNPRVEFHSETRGCLFDYDDQRSDIVQGLRRLEIEPECLGKIRPHYRPAALDLMAALRRLGRPARKKGGSPP